MWIREANTILRGLKAKLMNSLQKISLLQLFFYLYLFLVVLTITAYPSSEARRTRRRSEQEIQNSVE